MSKEDQATAFIVSSLKSGDRLKDGVDATGFRAHNIRKKTNMIAATMRSKSCLYSFYLVDRSNWSP